MSCSLLVYVISVWVVLSLSKHVNLCTGQCVLWTVDTIISSLPPLPPPPLSLSISLPPSSSLSPSSLPSQLTGGRASTTFLGIVVAGYSLGQLVTSPVLGIWSDRRPTREPLLVSLIVCVVANVGYCYASALSSQGEYVVLAARVLVGASAGRVLFSFSLALLHLNLLFFCFSSSSSSRLCCCGAVIHCCCHYSAGENQGNGWR